MAICMEREHICIHVEENMKEIGRREKSTERYLIFLHKYLIIKECVKNMKRIEKNYFFGQIGKYLKEYLMNSNL
jgi:hypothetical protein